MKRQSSFKTVALLMLIPLTGFALYLAWRFYREQRPIVAPSVAHREQRKERAAVIPPNATAPVPAKPQPKRRPAHGEIVVILDDVGFDRQPVERAMSIDPNVNFSILPNAAHAAEVAETLHGRNFEILCHLPMEPVGYPRQSPGPNAVMTSMSDAEIARLTQMNIGAVPYAVGVNNHMGSRATTDRRVMTSVLSSLPKGMYFIDSVTTGKSVAGRLAREMNVPTASRLVFLDDIQTDAAVQKQLDELVAAAASHGSAIGIGHMYPVTVRVLAEEAPRLRERGLRFVRASEVVQ